MTAPPFSASAFLRARGLEPLAWEEVLRRLEARLAPEDSATFARLHRAFVAYPAEHTCRAFYDFAARHDLHDLLACHRFDRLTALLRRLEDDLAAGGSSPVRALRALDHGAGSGVLAAWLRDVAQLEVSATDLSPETRARLEALGFPAPRPDDRFDLILCADSLGEIHADEDDWLSSPGNAGEEDFGGELEARYGFAHKLESFKDLLKPGGSILLYEPVPLEHFWRAAARLLETVGWRAEIVGSGATWGLRLHDGPMD